MTASISDIFIWMIAAAVVLGVMLRPWQLPEATWAITGTLLLPIGGFLPWASAFAAVAKGIDVYLFLIGMMVLSDVARREGLFDWLAV
ncbi:MAG: arsenic transporter, partial [Alphaproteobacteria bacterium]|nr:arsenic transporter [Alphaproteobacteria bacterium]